MKAVLHQLALLKTTPPNGLAIFTGLVTVNKTSTKKFVCVFEPLVAVTQGVYYCDQRFHTETLRRDLSTQLQSDAFGYMIVDGRHSVIGLVSGVERRILHEWKNISLPRKHSKGGQSSVRFENIRVEKRGHFIRKLCELANSVFLPNRTGDEGSSCKPIVSHLIVAGVAGLKNDFCDHDELDYRLHNIITRPLFDLPYGGPLGFDAAIEMSRDRIKHLSVMKEEQVLREFMTRLHTSFGATQDVVFGVRRVMQCLVSQRCVKKLILMDQLDLHRVVFRLPFPTNERKPDSNLLVQYLPSDAIPQVRQELESRIQQEGGEYHNHQVITEETRHLGEWIAENSASLGCPTVEFISDTSALARQFRSTYGGVAAHLFYRINAEVFFAAEEEEDQDWKDLFVVASANAIVGGGGDSSSDEEEDAALWDFSDPEEEEEEEEGEEEEGEEEYNRRRKRQRGRGGRGGRGRRGRNKKKPNRKTPTPPTTPWRNLRQERLEAVHSGKPSLTCIFIGHVDHGKSTIAGQLLVQSGAVEERLISQYKKRAQELRRDSWYLAYLLDSSEDERERGKTVEVGRTFFETSSKAFTILDSPGHENYVPCMLESASEADVAVLIVSAKQNEFERGLRGQTQEHALLVRSMGVKRLVVAVNKMDIVEWNPEVYGNIVSETRKILTGETGFKDRNLTFVPVSAMEGINIAEVPDSISEWYEGPCLMDALDKLKVPPRKSRASKSLRLPVIDKIHESGNFLTLVGKIQQGILRVGQTVSVSPEFTQGVVECIKIGCEVAPLAIPGDNVEIIVKGLSNDDVSVGSVVCGECDGMRPKKHLLAEIVVVEPDCFLTSGTSVMLHCHTSQARAVVTVLRRIMEDGEKRRVREGFTGNRLIVRLDLDRRVCALPFEESNWCGRFVLRRSSTVAVGKVLKAN